MQLKTVTLDDLRKADNIDELLSSMTDPLKQVDLSLLRGHLDKVRKNIEFNRNMDRVAVLSLAAQDFISELLPYIVRLYSNCQTETKKQKGLAFLEGYEDYCSARDIKPTDSAKKAYVDIDEDSIASAKKEAATKALFTYLTNRYQDMDNCHNYAKKMLGFDKAAEIKASEPRDID